MNIYTKNGDGGMTSLVHGPSIPKSDDRIELLGTLDELISHLGLVKADLSPGREKTLLEAIQKDLLAVVALTEDPHNRKNRLEEGAVEKLEAEIDAIRETLPAGKEEALPGENRLSARVSVARSVARRAERRLSTVSIKFGSDAMAKKYMNRLGDYLYVLARSMERRDRASGRKTGFEASEGDRDKREKQRFDRRDLKKGQRQPEDQSGDSEEADREDRGGGQTPRQTGGDRRLRARGKSDLRSRHGRRFPRKF